MLRFDNIFFKRNQHILLKISNTWYLKWLLGLNRLPKPIRGLKIDKITPESIHTITYNKNGKLKVRAIFFTRQRFAEALAYNLSPFCYLPNFRLRKMVWRFSPIGVIGSLVMLFLGHGFIFMGTTYSPQAGSGGANTTCDGYVGQENPNNSLWSTLVAAAGDTAGDTEASSAGTYFVCGDVSGRYNALYRSIFTIDTSGIGIGNTVTAATFNLYGFGKSDYGVTPNIDIYSSAPAANNALVAGDYDSCGSTSYTGSPITYAGWSTTGYNTFTFNATGKNAVSVDGITKLSARNANYDVANTAPTWSSATGAYVQFYCADQAGGSQDPYLDVTYSTISTIIHNLGTLGVGA